MSAATPQRTADIRVVAPAPITEPEITWVVETGNPYLRGDRVEHRARRRLGGEPLRRAAA